jgi:hypothetical protein
MSESGRHADGRRTDGQRRTTGFAGFKTTDTDEARIDALAEEFGNDTLGLRNALRIACEELDLDIDVEGER